MKSVGGNLLFTYSFFVVVELVGNEQIFIKSEIKISVSVENCFSFIVG